MMIWAGHETRMGDMRNVYKFRSENLKGKGHLEDQGVDVLIILDCFLEK